MAARYVVRWRFVYKGEVYGGRRVCGSILAAVYHYLRLWFNKYVVRVSLRRIY